MRVDRKYNICIIATHPIQYYVPWYQALARHAQINLKVFYCHQQTAQQQAQAGFGVDFDWDISLLEGYNFKFLKNKSKHPNVSKFFGCNTPEIAQIINENLFDAVIVHGWNILSFWQAIVTCWKKQTPVFIRGDSYLLSNRFFLKRWLKYPLYRWFIPKFDGYLVVGECAKEYYLYYGADKKKMFFVPHAVDNDFFALKSAAFFPEKNYLRKSWDIPESAIVFIFAGKLIAKKRPFDFLKALKLPSEQNNRIFGLVVGDGPLRSELEEFSKNNKLPVKFTGFLNQQEMPKAYVVADVLILPSDIGETWGLVVNEAMACGLPVVVSDRVGCALDLVGKLNAENIFNCGDIKALANIIEELSANPMQIVNLGFSAKEFIKQYTINSAVNGLLQALQFACGDNK